MGTVKTGPKRILLSVTVFLTVTIFHPGLVQASAGDWSSKGCGAINGLGHNSSKELPGLQFQSWVADNKSMIESLSVAAKNEENAVAQILAPRVLQSLAQKLGIPDFNRITTQYFPDGSIGFILPGFKEGLVFRPSAQSASPGASKGYQPPVMSAVPEVPAPKIDASTRETKELTENELQIWFDRNRSDILRVVNGPTGHVVVNRISDSLVRELNLDPKDAESASFERMRNGTIRIKFTPQIGPYRYVREFGNESTHTAKAEEKTPQALAEENPSWTPSPISGRNQAHPVKPVSESEVPNSNEASQKRVTDPLASRQTFSPGLESRWAQLEKQSHSFNWAEIEDMQPSDTRYLKAQEVLKQIDRLRGAGSKTLSGENKTENQARAIRSYRNAFSLLKHWVKTGEPLSLERIKELHRELSEGQSNYGTKLGEFRKHGSVGVMNVKDYIEGRGSMEIFVEPEKIPGLMQDFMNWYNLNKSTLPPMALAGQAYQRLISIHPFSDGNGRASRLVMDWILLAHGFPPTVYTSDKASQVPILKDFIHPDGKLTESAANVATQGVESSYDIIKRNISPRSFPKFNAE